MKALSSQYCFDSAEDPASFQMKFFKFDLQYLVKKNVQIYERKFGTEDLQYQDSKSWRMEEIVGLVVDEIDDLS